MPERFVKKEAVKFKPEKMVGVLRKRKVVIKESGSQLKISVEKRLKMPESKRKLHLRFSPSVQTEIVTLKKSKKLLNKTIKLKVRTSTSRRLDALKGRILVKKIKASKDLSKPTITASGVLLSKKLFVGTMNVTETNSIRVLPAGVFFIKGQNNKISIVHDPKSGQTLIDGSFSMTGGSFAFRLNPKTKELSLRGVIKSKPVKVNLSVAGVAGKPNTITAGFERNGLGVSGSYTVNSNNKMEYSFMVTFDVIAMLRKLK